MIKKAGISAGAAVFGIALLTGCELADMVNAKIIEEQIVVITKHNIVEEELEISKYRGYEADINVKQVIEIIKQDDD